MSKLDTAEQALHDNKPKDALTAIQEACVQLKKVMALVEAAERPTFVALSSELAVNLSAVTWQS